VHPCGQRGTVAVGASVTIGVGGLGVELDWGRTTVDGPETGSSNEGIHSRVPLWISALFMPFACMIAWWVVPKRAAMPHKVSPGCVTWMIHGGIVGLGAGCSVAVGLRVGVGIGSEGGAGGEHWRRTIKRIAPTGTSARALIAYRPLGCEYEQLERLVADLRECQRSPGSRAKATLPTPLPGSSGHRGPLGRRLPHHRSIRQAYP
jgi:hypothetical protein